MQYTNIVSAYRYPYAFVAFGGQTTHWWTKFLKPGFYHCMLVMGNGYEWILIDPVVHFHDLILIKQKNPCRILESRGYHCIRTTPHIPQQTKFHLRPITCVETVKKFLGITNPKIWTPYQLFCYLKNKKRKIFLDK